MPNHSLIELIKAKDKILKNNLREMTIFIATTQTKWQWISHLNLWRQEGSGYFSIAERKKTVNQEFYK